MSFFKKLSLIILIIILMLLSFKFGYVIAAERAQDFLNQLVCLPK